MKKIDLTGKRFGRLTVVKEVGRNNHKKILWWCLCTCGNHTIVAGNSLLREATKSCGCLRKEIMTKHGLSIKQSGLHRIWIGMRSRCRSPNNTAFKYYGARGISVCVEWENFSLFYVWAVQNGYRKGLTIERKNNDGNYSPENCKWIPQSEQPRNIKGVTFLTHDGQIRTCGEWERTLGLTKGTLKGRLKIGWSIEKALST